MNPGTLAKMVGVSSVRRAAPSVEPVESTEALLARLAGIDVPTARAFLADLAAMTAAMTHAELGIEYKQGEDTDERQ